MFHEQLKAIRAASGKTQKELADYLRISTQSVSKWEKGKALPSLDFLPKMANFFGCSVNLFFTEIEWSTTHDFHDTTSTKEPLMLEEKINRALKHFKLNAEVTKVYVGGRIYSFVVTMYEGVGLSDIKKRTNDILYQIDVERAIINTKDYKDNTFAIEIQSANFKEIPLKEALESNEYVNSNYKIPLVIGYDARGRLILDDLAKMPHLLIAGRVGSGKSTLIRNFLTCMTSRLSSKQLQLILCDLKRCEFSHAVEYPHLSGSVVQTLDEAVKKMQELFVVMRERKEILESAGVRNLDEYNAKTDTRLPKIVLVIDELSDFVMRYGDVENLIMGLAMAGRSVGIHLIIASQICSERLFSPLIRANIPSRATFQVSDKSKSKVLLEESGAELLSDYGDMLYCSCWMRGTKRIQVPYISPEKSVSMAKTE